MELKSEDQGGHNEDTSGSNRTFMELKYVMPTAAMAAIISSNRTFMELKSRTPGWTPRGHHRSNRTFMELKFE